MILLLVLTVSPLQLILQRGGENGGRMHKWQTVCVFFWKTTKHQRNKNKNQKQSKQQQPLLLQQQQLSLQQQ